MFSRRGHVLGIPAIDAPRILGIVLFLLEALDSGRGPQKIKNVSNNIFPLNNLNQNV